MKNTYIQLASRLQSRRSSILQSWMERRRERALENGVTLRSRKAWMDHMPQIFDQILERIRGEGSGDAELGEDHAEVRLSQGFDLAEAILDLHLLEDLIHEQIEEFISASEVETPPEAVHKLGHSVSRFLNACVVESAYASLRMESAKHRTREIQLNHRIQTLVARLEDYLEIIGDSSHDLRGSNDVLLRLAEHALKQRAEEGDSDPFPLLQALARGLLYNQEILQDLSLLSLDRTPGCPENLQSLEIIQSVGERCALANDAKISRIKWNSAENFPLFLNRLGLERILFNLIENALSHGSGTEVLLQWNVSDEDSSYWNFETENKLPRPIRGEEAKPGVWVEHPPFSNLGLGLSVVSRLIENMEGELHFMLVDETILRVRVHLPLRMQNPDTETDTVAFAVP